MQLGDDALRRMDTDLDRLAVVLLPSDVLNVNDILLTVDLDDLSVTSLVGSSDHLHFIVLTNGYRANLHDPIN